MFVTLFLKGSASNNEGMKIPREENVSYKVFLLYFNSNQNLSDKMVLIFPFIFIIF
jgi:hypothetical protein